MKKLLIILTSISITSNAVFNVISCGVTEDEEGYENEITSNSRYSKIINGIEKNTLFTVLENGIDAEFLTTNNTGLDAESLIQDEALKNDLSITDLTVLDDIEKPLKEGDNEFNIDLVIGNKSSKLKTKIKNVKSGKLTEKEKEDQVETFIEQEAEIPIHSISDTLATAQVVKKRLHDLGETNAEVEIVNEADTVESEHIEKLGFNSLAEKKSSWSLKVTKLKNPKKSMIKKRVIVKKIDTSKIDKASEVEKENVAFNEISKVLNNSSFDTYKYLSTTNTFKDAAEIAKSIANIYAAHLKDLKISYKLSNENERLKVDNNRFQLIFQYKTNPTRTINIVLNNVTDVKDDRELSLKVIKNKFEKGVEGKNLYGWNTIFDALNHFQAEATKINKNTYVSLSKDFVNKKVNLKVWKNEVAKIIKKSAKSVSSLPTDLVVDIALYSPYLIQKIIKDNKKDDLSTLLFSVKNRSDFYLKGAKEQPIELEVTFENPFTAIKTNKSIVNSENKKVKTTKVTGKIKNVKPRSIPDAKKLIEKEKLTVNEKITFYEALLAFKSHINNILFFPGIGKTSFDFKIDFKKQNKKNEYLKPGLNKIKGLIQPMKLSSVFKGTLELTLNIKYNTKPTKK